MKNKKVVIIGGVAGGASCAARLRRMDEEAEIIMVERGPHVSYSNCGLPYYIGGIITEEQRLLVANPALFEERFRVRVLTGTEALSIDRGRKCVRLREHTSQREWDESYDALVLSPGASPLRPPLPGLDLPGVFTLRSIPDAQAIRGWIEQTQARRAVIVGGGFIGLEMAENLVCRGLETTVVEMLPQVMPPLDMEMAERVARHLRKNGVHLQLGSALSAIEAEGKKLIVRTQDGGQLSADLVILALGVRPEVTLARAAGLELGSRGGIRVDAQMRTSDPAIWAVGDAVEKTDFILGIPTLIPLAGPANREARIAADSIAGRARSFRGVQGTAIVGLFGLQVASTGLSEKALQRAGVTDYEKVYLHPSDHSGYYPGAQRMLLKLIFRRSDGRVLGAQAVGPAGVDRRVDVIAMAIQMRATVFDLEEAELCYAPQFGSAKDPVNMAGMVAANVLRGDEPVRHWNDPDDAPEIHWLDVRDDDEIAPGKHPLARHIPLHQLRQRIEELPRQGEIRVYCASGIRSHTATRLLRQKGLDARNVSGGWLARSA